MPSPLLEAPSSQIHRNSALNLGLKRTSEKNKKNKMRGTNACIKTRFVYKLGLKKKAKGEKRAFLYN